MIGQIDEEFYWEVYNYKKFNTKKKSVKRGEVGMWGVWGEMWGCEEKDVELWRSKHTCNQKYEWKTSFHV